MKIICPQEDFAAAINIVSKAVATKTTVTIMECILITAYGDEIKLTANNNEIGIDTILNGKIEEEGMIAFDAKFFADIIRSLPNSDVELTTNEKYAGTILCQPSNTERIELGIPGRPGDDFPYLPEINQKGAIEISQMSLRDIIRQTAFASSESDSNIIMSGEHFKIEGNKLQVTAVDGHRFAVRKIILKDNYENVEAIIPAKTLNELNKILKDDANEIVQMFFSDKYLMFMFDTTVVVTRLIEGEFVNIERMMMNDYQTKFVVPKKILSETLKRASLISREGDKKPIVMDITDNKIYIGIKGINANQNEEIAIEKEGKNLKIGFNPVFLLDVLNVIDEEEVTIYMESAKYPCYIKDEQDTYNYMVLPVNI